jgi:hypothetical protein
MIEIELVMALLMFDSYLLCFLRYLIVTLEPVSKQSALVGLENPNLIGGATQALQL